MDNQLCFIQAAAHFGDYTAALAKDSGMELIAAFSDIVLKDKYKNELRYKCEKRMVKYKYEIRTIQHKYAVIQNKQRERSAQREPRRRAHNAQGVRGPGDGFRPMKRPPSGDARSAPVRCVKQGAVRWQGGVPRTDYFWFGLRGYSRI
jgi:hypothetical protein